VKDDCVYLLHIRDAVNRIFEYSKGGAEEFLRDPKTQDAVVRNLEIIGEAVKHISERLRTQHPDIAWKRIAGMRDKMIHEYFGVNVQLVWEVVRQELPGLRRKVEDILSSTEGGEPEKGSDPV
jgi:uncharacterized protein with HEPN domain